jgi:hypothetical protein
MSDKVLISSYLTSLERTFNFCDKMRFWGTFATMTTYVAYFRVSTFRQGQSGLGLEAQQAAGQNFLRGDAPLVASFLEIESGKKNERPQLAAAIERARQEGAVLLVAELDRLARNVAFPPALEHYLGRY